MSLGFNLDFSNISKSVNLFLEATLENKVTWNSMALEDLKNESKNKKEKIEMIMRYEERSKEYVNKNLKNLTLASFNKPYIIKSYLNKLAINKKTAKEIKELKKEVKRLDGRINNFKFINFEEDCFFIDFKTYRENYRFIIGTINDDGVCTAQFDYLGNERGYYERTTQFYSSTGNYFKCINSIECPELITLRMLIKKYINKGIENVGISIT